LLGSPFSKKPTQLTVFAGEFFEHLLENLPTNL
jgi:hypothetical protein